MKWLLYKFARIVRLSVSSTPPGLFEDARLHEFLPDDNGEATLPLTTKGQIMDGDIVTVTGVGHTTRTISIVYRNPARLLGHGQRYRVIIYD